MYTIFVSIRNENIWIATDIGITIYDTKPDITSSTSYSILNTGNGFTQQSNNLINTY